MARLIDADALQEVIKQDWFLDVLLTQTGKNDMAQKLVYMIDSVPLAYDVERVVEEIEKMEDTDTREIYLRHHIDRDEAIKIIRKGGLE